MRRGVREVAAKAAALCAYAHLLVGQGESAEQAVHAERGAQGGVARAGAALRLQERRHERDRDRLPRARKPLRPGRGAQGARGTRGARGVREDGEGRQPALGPEPAARLQRVPRQAPRAPLPLLRARREAGAQGAAPAHAHRVEAARGVAGAPDDGAGGERLARRARAQAHACTRARAFDAHPPLPSARRNLTVASSPLTRSATPTSRGGLLGAAERGNAAARQRRTSYAPPRPRHARSPSPPAPPPPSPPRPPPLPPPPPPTTTTTTSCHPRSCHRYGR